MNIIEELSRVKYQLQSVEASRSNLIDLLAKMDNELLVHESKLGELTISRQFYKKAIDIVYERSIQELKDVINSALSYIFIDKNIQVDIELSDKRGKSMTFIITHNDKRVNLKRGMGMGVKCVISCILHMYYLQCKNSPYLLLDEAYSNISKEYITNFFDFLQKMCERLNFTIILITHDERFIQYANKVYEINNGYSSVIKG